MGLDGVEFGLCEGFDGIVGGIFEEGFEDAGCGLGVAQVLGVDTGADDGDDISFVVVGVGDEEGLVGVEGLLSLVGLVEVVGDLVLGVAVHGGGAVVVEVIDHGEVAVCGGVEVALVEAL